MEHLRGFWPFLHDKTMNWDKREKYKRTQNGTLSGISTLILMQQTMDRNL